MTPPPTKPARRRIVLVKGTAGLGNRIYAVLSALLYAKLAGRKVVVDWRDGYYADPGVNAFSLLFRSASITALEIPLPTGSVAPWMWDHRLDVSAEDMYRNLGPAGARGCPFVGSLYSFDPAELHQSEDVLVTWSLIPVIKQLRHHFVGPWHAWGCLEEEAILARLLHENLEVHPDIMTRVAEIERRWPDRPRIGVHVRNTDRKTNLRLLHNRLSRLIDRQSDAVIFLATDAASVEKDFRRRYPEVLTVPKWFPHNGPLHTLAAACPDRLEMARASLVEMRLLAGCHHLVINGNSSFSVITKLWWKGRPDQAIDVSSWAWLPPGVRSRAWRVRDAVRWARWLQMGRRHIEKQRVRRAEIL